MTETNNRITIRVWGDYACFTRPEMKVERVSYPICTPSAARGILEAIYWEPQMYYVIDNIAVVKKGRWFTFRRNEVTKVISLNEVPKWMRGKTPIAYIEASDPDTRSQRNMLGLADVEYLITAEVRTSGLYNAGRNHRDKYLREIRSRASKGKCWHRPAFGCREFAIDFDLVDDIQATLEQRSAEIRGTKDWHQAWQPDEPLGLMLYDVFDHAQRREGFGWLKHHDLAEKHRQRDEQKKQVPKREQKDALEEPIMDYEGLMVRPLAYFFHAEVQGARMDCHPDRVKILRPMGKEVS